MSVFISLIPVFLCVWNGEVSIFLYTVEEVFLFMDGINEDLCTFLVLLYPAMNVLSADLHTKGV